MGRTAIRCGRAMEHDEAPGYAPANCRGGLTLKTSQFLLSGDRENSDRATSVACGVPLANQNGLENLGADARAWMEKSLHGLDEWLVGTVTGSGSGVGFKPGPLHPTAGFRIFHESIPNEAGAEIFRHQHGNSRIN